MQPNPYQAPTADLSLPADGSHDQSSPFSAHGRFGRLSYLAWCVALGFAVWAVMLVAIGAAVTGGGEAAMAAIPLMAMVVTLPPAVIFAIRRLHDFGASGWWALLLIVPVVSAVAALVLLFRAGDPEANRFGPPRVTRGWEKVLGYIGVGFGVLAVVGIVAAILIPQLAG